MKNNIFLPVSIILSGIIISVAMLYAVGKQAGPTKTTATILNSVSLIDDDIVLGNPQAKVTLTLFGDYQCPYCKEMYDQAEKQLRRDYVDTGLINMVYRDFPLDQIHPNARPAALAAQCAADQNKYWEYHDALYARQASLATLDFVNLAKILGLNEASFKKCIDTQKYAQEIQDDLEYGIKIGVRATPTVFVGNKKIEGWSAKIYQEIQAAIDEELVAK